MSEKQEENALNEAKKSLFKDFPRLGDKPAPTEAKRGYDVAGMKVSELLALRARIDERLPPRRLHEVDLEEEVLLQFARTKELYNDVATDSETPANQRAQVANSCTTILQQLIQMQTRLYDAGRVRAMETALTKTLRELDAKVQQRFFELYARNLEAESMPSKEERK